MIGGGATDNWWVEASDAVKHLTIIRENPPPSISVSSAETEKSWYKV